MENLNTLYAAIKVAAANRDEVYKRFCEGKHPDAERILSLENGVVSDLARDYKANGGKRNIDKFLR